MITKTKNNRLLSQSYNDSMVLALLLVLYAVDGYIIVKNVSVSIITTIIILIAVSVLGLTLINYLRRSLNDDNIQYLSYVYLFKLMLLLVFLYAGWVPLLDKDSMRFGFDPQRYYFDAYELAESGFNYDAISYYIGMDSPGILYFYGILFYLFGHNPVIPALINAFITLLATLLLVHLGYTIKTERSSRDWMLGLCMVLPEVLWYDLMTSRETIIMSLIIFSIYPFARAFAKKGDLHIFFWERVMSILGLIGLGVIRAPILFITVFIIILLLFLRQVAISGLFTKIITVLLLFLTLVYAPIIAGKVMGREYSLIEATKEKMEEGSQIYAEWTERSVGHLLVPKNYYEIILFAPLRFFCYLNSPIPNIKFSFSGIREGDWYCWGNLISTTSSIIYLLYFPYVLASLINTREEKRWLAFHIPFWILMTAISGGNSIIHERYRIMAIPFLWGCIWLGEECNKGQMRRAYASWIGILFSAWVFYIGYKFFFE